MRSYCILFLAVFLDAGCTGHMVDVGESADSSGATPSTSGQTADATVVSATFTALDVQAAVAACNGPHGSVDPTMTRQDVQDRVVGAWWECSTSDSAGNGNDPASAVYGPDGSWRRLDPDGNGGLVEGHGLEDESTYRVAFGDDASPSCANNNCLLYLQGPADNGSELGVAFEASPRWMWLGGQYWYVPLTATPAATDQDAGGD
jgi:hypothetical protein